MCPTGYYRRLALMVLTLPAWTGCTQTTEERQTTPERHPAQAREPAANGTATRESVPTDPSILRDAAEEAMATARQFAAQETFRRETRQRLEAIQRQLDELKNYLERAGSPSAEDVHQTLRAMESQLAQARRILQQERTDTLIAWQQLRGSLERDARTTERLATTETLSPSASGSVTSEGLEKTPPASSPTEDSPTVVPRPESTDGPAASAVQDSGSSTDPAQDPAGS